MRAAYFLLMRHTKHQLLRLLRESQPGILSHPQSWRDHWPCSPGGDAGRRSWLLCSCALFVASLCVTVF
ncbi:MAG: hypothetical protein AAFY60_09675, partial [Myxococcota bacterium]